MDPRIILLIFLFVTVMSGFLFLVLTFEKRRIEERKERENFL